MNRDWSDFKGLYGNIAGAREEFETACESLFRKLYPNLHVSQMKVTVGDGGIDIFIGEFGVEPIIVIQCKFFLDSFGDSQKNQIRDSFNAAINSEKYKLKEWILCIPRIINIDENSWWFKWKHKKLAEHKKPSDFIKLKNGNELIDLLKEHNLYNRIFKIDDSIKINEIHDFLMPKRPETVTDVNPQVVLFNNYSKRCELYYFEREVDKEFFNSLKLSNIWVFGESGFGKTALVNRNLTKHDLEYCFCDLSPINIVSSEQVIEEVLIKIEEKFNTDRDPSKGSNKIKQIASILCDKSKRNIIIVIDELAVKDNNVLKSIASDLLNLVVHYNNLTTDGNLKFVVSTISSPCKIIDNPSKATEYFQYIDCNNWENDIEKLFDILVSSLSLDLDEYKAVILKASNSPRILKTILRKIVLLENINPLSIDTTIKKTISELVQ